MLEWYVLQSFKICKKNIPRVTHYAVLRSALIMYLWRKIRTPRTFIELRSEQNCNRAFILSHDYFTHRTITVSIVYLKAVTIASSCKHTACQLFLVIQFIATLYFLSTSSFSELITRDWATRIVRQRFPEDVMATPAWWLGGERHSIVFSTRAANCPFIGTRGHCQISCLTVILLDRIWSVSDSQTNCVIDLYDSSSHLVLYGINNFKSQYTAFDTVSDDYCVLF